MYKIYTGKELWIYAYETKKTAMDRMGVPRRQNPRVVRGRSKSKQMVACFFGKNNHVATVPLKECKTVNSE